VNPERACATYQLGMPSAKGEKSWWWGGGEILLQNLSHPIPRNLVGALGRTLISCSQPGGCPFKGRGDGITGGGGGGENERKEV